MSDPRCVFCDLENEERLIATVDGHHVLATLGQITDGGYVLLVPKKHVPCMGALSMSELSSMIPVLRAACIALSAEYFRTAELPFPVTIFEHGIVGQTVKHAHTSRARDRRYDG